MANFIKNFKNQNYNDGFLPQSVLEELSKKWNGNLEYVYKENGTYMLKCSAPPTPIIMNLRNPKVFSVRLKVPDR